MLVLDPTSGAIKHATIRQLPDYLGPGDLLVLNDSRVLPARLHGRRRDGGEAEVLLLRPVDGDRHRWEALIRPARRLAAGSQVRFDGSALAVAIDERHGETATVRLNGVADPLTEVRRIGEIPTPPYIRERLRDAERYQTVFARDEGSAAAPTAGLHFTPELLDRLDVERVTLHVGLDTFRPVGEARLEDHRMHGERYSVADAAWSRIEAAAHVLAVGTTTVRVLETLARGGPHSGRTDLFITPGFEFRRTDALLTNFHLPRSTLLALVMAFAGVEETRRLYRVAVEERYRFYSFGDAMLIL